MAKERLQKILAQAGVASRRAAEALIANGDVRINGRIVTELGVRADSSRDRIEVKGERIVAEKPAYYVLNKPREVVTTLSDPEGRATIGDLLKRIPERVYPVGRLDYHTSGVLLLTNDGEMAQALLHPTRGVPKAYVVKVKGHVPIPKLEALRKGVVLDDGKPTKAAELFVVREEKNNTWLQITITEGRNRQIHRMCEAVNLRVQRLSRVAFAGVTAEGLRPGDYRPLANRELMKLERDYRNPATRQRVEQARAKRHADAGFDFDESAVVRAPRGPRRGNVSTLHAVEKEAQETPRARARRGKKLFREQARARAEEVFPTADKQRGRFPKRGDATTDAAQQDPRARFKRRGDVTPGTARQDPRQRFQKRADAATSTTQQDPRARFKRQGDVTSGAARQDPRDRFQKRGEATSDAAQKDPRARFKRRGDVTSGTAQQDPRARFQKRGDATSGSAQQAPRKRFTKRSHSRR